MAFSMTVMYRHGIMIVNNKILQYVTEFWKITCSGEAFEKTDNFFRTMYLHRHIWYCSNVTSHSLAASTKRYEYLRRKRVLHPLISKFFNHLQSGGARKCDVTFERYRSYIIHLLQCRKSLLCDTSSSSSYGGFFMVL